MTNREGGFTTIATSGSAALGGKAAWNAGNEILSISVVTQSVPTEYFTMRGYYPSESRFVFWKTTDKTSVNPNGYPLIDITQDK